MQWNAMCDEIEVIKMRSVSSSIGMHVQASPSEPRSWKQDSLRGLRKVHNQMS